MLGGRDRSPVTAGGDHTVPSASSSLSTPLPGSDALPPAARPYHDSLDVPGGTDPPPRAVSGSAAGAGGDQDGRDDHSASDELVDDATTLYSSFSVSRQYRE